MVRFGCVTAEISRIAALAAMGYDYVELGAQTLRPLENDDEFAPVADRLRGAPLRPEVLAGLVPSFVGLCVAGPAVNRTELRAYVQTVVRRAADVGVETLVFGSAVARKFPPDFPARKARAQVQDFVAYTADLAADRGLVLAVEVLNRAETSLITTVDEAVAFVAELDHPAVRIAIDYYHLLADGVPLDALDTAAGLIGHVHTADAGRQPPGLGNSDQRAFLGKLAQLGYQGRISVECRFTDFDNEAPAVLAFLKAQWAAATAA